MKKYILKRTMLGLATMLFVLVFVFVAARFTGNPIEFMYPEGLEPGQLEAYNEKYGLDKSYIEQFENYIKNVFQGDFGMSITERRPVTEVVFPRVAETFKLGIWALFISVILGLFFGILFALNQGKMFVKIADSMMSFIYSIPGFVLAIGLMYIFSFKLNLLPSQGASGPLSYIMPVTCLTLGPTITITKHIRSNVLESLREDYIQTAVSKGIGKKRATIDHALKNVLIPTITVIAGVVTGIIAGSTTIEAVFSWPGVGHTLVRSVLNRDYPVIQFSIVLLSVIIILINYTLDILYLVVDPRIGGDGKS